VIPRLEQAGIGWHEIRIKPLFIKGFF